MVYVKTQRFKYISKCTIIQRFFSDFRDGPKYAFNGLFSNAGDLVMVQLLLLIHTKDGSDGTQNDPGHPDNDLG